MVYTSAFSLFYYESGFYEFVFSFTHFSLGKPGLDV